MATPKTIPLHSLKAQLAELWAMADDTEVFFGAGDLSLNRAQAFTYQADGKTPAVVNIEFKEAYRVTADPGAD